MRSLLPWLLFGVLSCSSASPPAAAPPVAPSDPPPGAPITFAYSFEYNPFVIHLKRNGAPYSGPATLVGNALESPLSFEQGRVMIDAEFVPQLARQTTLELQVDGQPIPLSSGASKVLRCAERIAELQQLDPCGTPLPAVELFPQDCDQPGASAWYATHDAHQRRFEACYADLLPATLDRLARTPAVAPSACPRLLGLAGPSPSEDTTVALWPVCGKFLPQSLQRSAQNAYLRRRLPVAFEEAKSATSERMREFYTTYRTLAPQEAEEIRKVAAQRFSPAGLNEARWKALRASVEATPSKERIFALCDTLDSKIWIQVRAKPYSYSTKTPYLGYPVSQRVMYPRRYSTTPSATEQAILTQKVSAIVGKRELLVSTSCKDDGLWFLRS